MDLTVNDLLEITMGMDCLGQEALNCWQYNIQTMPDPVGAVQIAEAWWNHVKTTYRGLFTNDQVHAYSFVRIRELNNPVGALAEYSIPFAEQAGDRAAGGATDQMPPFASAGVRLVVGTRATRPGQKRLPGVTERDQASGFLVNTGFYLDSVSDLMDVMVAPMILGAPAALVELIPIVTRKDATGAVTAHQPVTGYLINDHVTTQNSRKIGRGS